MDTITIRQARAADAERLNEALRHLSTHIGDTHMATADMVREHGFGPHPTFRGLLAESDGEVVGATIYSPLFSTAFGGAGVYVSDLWVAASTRGAGLGRRLLAAVADDARATWGAIFLKLTVYDTNADARAFYDRLEFQTAEGETVLRLDETGLAALKTTREQHR